MSGLLIGEVAKRTGFPPPTIRYYEEVGLLKKPSRAESGYRSYSSKTVDELLFVKKAQALGFSLEEITEILQLSRSGQKPCERVLTMSHRHLDAIDARIRDLQKFRGYLAAEISKWDHQGTAVTCDGLCQFISDAAPEPQPPEIFERHLPRRRRTR
jgi:MerR family transcriptional regulator, copper efflux regulator